MQTEKRQGGPFPRGSLVPTFLFRHTWTTLSLSMSLHHGPRPVRVHDARKAVVTGLTYSWKREKRTFTATDFSVPGFGVIAEGERKKLKSGDIWATSCYSGFAEL